MRIISVLLIWSLLYSMIACYSTKQISQKDEIEKEVPIGDVVFIRTDQHIYDLHPPYHYKVIQDTMIGQGRNMNYQEGFIRKENFKIAVSDIRELKVRKFQNTETVILIIGGVVVIGGMSLIVLMSHAASSTFN